MIELRGVSFAYPRRPPVLREVCLTVDPGEVLVVLGNNGAGKSTLLHCLTGHLVPSAGAAVVDGREVRTYRLGEYARVVSFVPQRADVSHKIVHDAVLLGRKPFFQLGPSREDLAITERIIAQLGLAGIAFRYLDELSGGQQQKVAVARALAGTPRVLILDEPTSSLDIRNQNEVLGLVRRAALQEGIAVIAVLHNVNEAFHVADRIALLKSGQVIDIAPTAAVTAENLSYTMGTRIELGHVAGRRVAVAVDLADQP